MMIIAKLISNWRLRPISFLTNHLYFNVWVVNIFFAKVDNLWGYHQLCLAEDSSEVTAIITPWGLHRIFACPFGIWVNIRQGSRTRFLRIIYLNCSIVHIDDAVTFGRDVEGFMDRVLSQMAKFNVWLKPSKFFWNDINRIPGSRI